MINERAEKLKDSIEETEEDIFNFQIVIQKLNKDFFNISDIEIKEDIFLLINKYENKIKYLEELKKSDEDTLNLFC